jgi:hypothetical protein
MVDIECVYLSWLLWYPVQERIYLNRGEKLMNPGQEMFAH